MCMFLSYYSAHARRAPGVTYMMCVGSSFVNEVDRIHHGIRALISIVDRKHYFILLRILNGNSVKIVIDIPNYFVMYGSYIRCGLRIAKRFSHQSLWKTESWRQGISFFSAHFNFPMILSRALQPPNLTFTYAPIFSGWDYRLRI